MTNPKHSYKNKADVKFSVKHIGKPLSQIQNRNTLIKNIVKILIIKVIRTMLVNPARYIMVKLAAVKHGIFVN